MQTRNAIGEEFFGEPPREPQGARLAGHPAGLTKRFSRMAGDDVPWKKPRPRSAGPKVTLTPESVAWARAEARRAGRRYPNLVDNLRAARRQREQGGTGSDHP